MKKMKWLVLNCCVLYAVALCFLVFTVAVFQWQYRPVNNIPDFSSISDVKQRKHAFIDFLSPHVLSVVNQYKDDKVVLEKLYNHYMDGKDLSKYDRQWLKMKAVDVGISRAYIVDMQLFHDLRRRLDIIPPSLILAQAAIETGWGTSRFFKGGLSLFGQQCYTKGCGLVPKNRNPDARHEVKRFDSVEQAIVAYIQNINMSRSYTKLHYMRMSMRMAGVSLSGKKLADGLTNYSELGEEYNLRVRQLISQNALDKYDEMVENIQHIIMEKGYY